LYYITSDILEIATLAHVDRIFSLLMKGTNEADIKNLQKIQGRN